MKIFLAEIDSQVYDNDIVFIVVAEDLPQAEKIVKDRYGQFISKQLIAELPSSIAQIIHEYSPHEGDPALGE